MFEHLFPFVVILLMTWRDTRRFGFEHWRRWLFFNSLFVLCAYLFIYEVMRNTR
jgi:hypothetical protein